MATLRLRSTAEVDHTVVHASGLLTLHSVPALRAILLKGLTDVGRVVAEVAGVRLLGPSCALVFPAVQAAAGGWPRARLAIAGADLNFRAALRASRIDGFVPLASNQADALRRLDARPSRLRQIFHAEGVPSAIARSRWFARDVCEDWLLGEEMSEAAVLIVNELVTNGVAHAGTASRVKLELWPAGLTVSVRDGSPDQPVLRAPTAAEPHGRGLRLIEHLAAEWGVIRHPEGKTVWALLPLPPGPRAHRSRLG